MIICYSIRGHPYCSEKINGFFSPNDAGKHLPPFFWTRKNLVGTFRSHSEPEALFPHTLNCLTHSCSRFPLMFTTAVIALDLISPLL